MSCMTSTLPKNFFGQLHHYGRRCHSKHPQLLTACASFHEIWKARQTNGKARPNLLHRLTVHLNDRGFMYTGTNAHGPWIAIPFSSKVDNLFF